MQIQILYPDDWHHHLRDGDMLATTVPMLAAHFKRAIIMPNLNPAVRTVADATGYYQRIQEHIPAGSSFKPLMTLYLTDETTVQDIEAAAASDIVHAVKLYPSGATTNSSQGVKKLEKLYPVLEAMSGFDIPLLIHGEVTDNNIDIFDREKAFIDTTLADIRQRFPKLRIVLEHITTKDAVQYITTTNNIAATITPHHLAFNRNDMLAKGIRPHYYCLPILKRNIHQEALIKAATSGNCKFFLGTDSAPHVQSAKESSCGCAGIYNAPVALAVYATIFEQYDALNALEGFCSTNGAEFYKLPINTDKITLKRQDWQVPNKYSSANGDIIPMYANSTLSYQVVT